MPELFIPTNTVRGLNSTAPSAIDLKFLSLRDLSGYGCMVQATFMSIGALSVESVWSRIG